MSTARARAELDWHPQRTSRDAIDELLRGLRSGAGGPTPPLADVVHGGRAAEIGSGIGDRP